MRLDKYLKVSRIIKRRTVANEVCDAKHVTVNGKIARASYEVKEGDLIEIQMGENLTKYKVDVTNTPLRYNNFGYIIRINGSASNIEYLGYAQPFGLAWEDNEESPFYVGEQLSGDTTVNSPTDILYNKPTFERQVRIVLSGGEFDNIYSNDLAMQRAKYELYLRAKLHDSIDITVVPIYWLDVNQIIEYQMPNESEPSYWLIKSISTDFSVDGSQKISAIRYYTV